MKCYLCMLSVNYLRCCNAAVLLVTTTDRDFRWLFVTDGSVARDGFNFQYKGEKIRHTSTRVGHTVFCRFVCRMARGLIHTQTRIDTHNTYTKSRTLTHIRKHSRRRARTHTHVHTHTFTNTPKRSYAHAYRHILTCKLNHVTC